MQQKDGAFFHIHSARLYILIGYFSPLILMYVLLIPVFFFFPFFSGFVFGGSCMFVFHFGGFSK